jgi:hypothetical protein
MLSRGLWFVVVGLIGGVSALAQSQLTSDGVDALLRSSYKQINGNQHPELVPFSLRMDIFFSFWQRTETGWQAEFQSRLSQDDFAVLDEYARAHSEAKRADDLAHQREWMGIAANAAGMSAVQIATAIKQATDRSKAAQEARRRSVLDRLSKDAQVLIQTVAYERIRPVFTEEDPLVVARAEPEFYKAQIIGAYEAVRPGQSQ